jgi:hypothetical protein
MRGIATVIVVGFFSIILFGIVAPAILEPMVDVFVSHEAVQSSQIDGTAFANSLLRSVLVYGPLFVLGSGVASAVVWYFRRERSARRRV